LRGSVLEFECVTMGEKIAKKNYCGVKNEPDMFSCSKQHYSETL